MKIAFSFQIPVKYLVILFLHFLRRNSAIGVISFNLWLYFYFT